LNHPFCATDEFSKAIVLRACHGAEPTLLPPGGFRQPAKFASRLRPIKQVVVDLYPKESDKFEFQIRENQAKPDLLPSDNLPTTVCAPE
jgi:hypothetical protein